MMGMPALGAGMTELMAGCLILCAKPGALILMKFFLSLAVLFSTVTFPFTASAQWSNRYPAAEGFGHQVYLEGFELPVLNSGPIDPAPSPDGNSVAFSAKGWLWLMDLKSGNARRLTSSGGIDSRPEWSPNGKNLVFIRDNGSQLSIVSLNLKSGEERLLVNVQAINLDPAFSPDGAFVYYASAESGQIELWRVALDSLVREQVTPSGPLLKRPLKRRPIVLSGGNLVLYLKKQDTADSIELYNTITQASTPLLKDRLAAQADMTLSPDAKYLAYTWPFDGGYELRVLSVAEPDTSVLLTQGLGQPLAPAFSRDGAWVYFSENIDEERSELRRISINGGAVETLRVNEWDWGTDTGTLVITTNLSGQPAAVRMSVVDQAGHPVLPTFGAVHSEGQHGRIFFYSNGYIELIAPAGPVTVSVVHGFETPELVETVVVRAKATTQVDLVLQQVWDAADNGWYSADNHFHLNYGGPYRLTPGDLVMPMQGEALDVAFPLLANLHNRFLEQDLWGWSLESGPIIHFGQEVRAHFLGHVGLIGNDALFWPWVWGPGYQVYANDDRINAEALRFARASGGLGGYVHPVAGRDPFTTETYGQVPIGFVADAVLGEVDLIEVGCLWTDEIGTAALWHTVLNLGIPLAASAGSDVMMDYFRTMAVGATRVYVKPEGELNTASYLKALKEGRSFVSSGPMLEFEVDGMEPGEAIVLTPTGSEAAGSDSETAAGVPDGWVTWGLNVHSALPYDSVEIFVNGEVVETQLGSHIAGSVNYTGLVEVPIGGWITARVLGPDGGWPSMDSYLYAETSPVWFGQVGSTDPVAARQAAAKLLRVLDVAEEKLIAGYGSTPIPNLLGHFQLARIRLEEIAAE